MKMMKCEAFWLTISHFPSFFSEKDEIPETPRSPVDSEDEDEVGLDADTKLKRRRARAMAVSAEPIDPKTIKERLKLVPNVEKSPEQTNQLLEVHLSSPSP
jgi:hypothetical protein